MWQKIETNGTSRKPVITSTFSIDVGFPCLMANPALGGNQIQSTLRILDTNPHQQNMGAPEHKILSACPDQNYNHFLDQIIISLDSQ